MITKFLTKEQALVKLKHFCAYQERCHKDVKEKLYGFGIKKSDREDIVAILIEENCLNEERFALHYARGKFRLKQWGKNKIRYSFKRKNLSEYCIKKALMSIDPELYNKTLRDVSIKKYSSLKGVQDIIRKKKTIDYLLVKGYEKELVYQVVSSEL